MRYFLVVCVLLSGCNFANPEPSVAVKEPPHPVTVVRVVDGDTIDVTLLGQRTRLRLIGLDTPETVDPRKPVQCYGREASAHAHTLLDQQTVRIEFDPSQGRLDSFGRTLAYVWIADHNFNETMIRDGYAHEYTYRNNPYKYQTQFKAAQRQAQAEQLGLWSHSTCNGITNQSRND